MKRRALWVGACAIAAGLVLLVLFLRSRTDFERDPVDWSARAASSQDATAATAASLPNSAVESLPGKTRTPSVDPSAAQAPTEDAASRFAIVAEDGTPVAEAQVALFREQTLLDFAVSDAHGKVQFAASSGSAEIAVLAPGRPLFRRSVDLGAGVQELTLPEGEPLSGWVDVEGAAPPEAVALTWIPDFQPLAAFEGLPPSVRERLRGNFGLAGCPRTTTDAQGGFTFRGLQGGASGRLVWDGPYWFHDEAKDVDRRDLPLPAPRRDVRLHWIAGLELRLRVVDSRSAPVPGAKVELVSLIQTELGHDQHTTERTADDQGRLRFALPRKLSASLRAVVALADGGGATAHELRLPGVQRGVWDAGDLAVQPTRALAVRVEDSEGHPVESASVIPQPSVTGDDRVFTDAEGRCRLTLALGVEKIAVHAQGYDLARAAVPADAVELVVVLESRCQVEFVITGFEGRSRALRVVLTGTPPLFGNVAPTDRGDRGRGSLGVDAGGRCLTPDLTPGNPVHAELRYASGHVLATAEVPGLAKGEHRRVELAVTAQPLEFRVRVRTEAGEPVANAKVSLKYPASGSSGGEPVDAAGEIRLGPIYAQPFTLVAQAPGLAPQALYGVTVPPDEIVIVLEVPRRVELELRNPDGSLFVGKAEVFVSTGGAGDGTAASNGAGRWTLDGLPRGEVTIYVESEFGELTVLHDATDPKRVLVVGEPGSVSVNASSAGGHATQEWAVALADAGSSRPRTRTRFFFDESGHKELVFQGLPLGAYDVWLETRGTTPDGRWSRVGAPARAKLDPDSARVELTY